MLRPDRREGAVAIIEVEGLKKEYRRLRGGSTVAIDGLDLSVPEGGVFGFLGPNGSGKTTTIRCLLGLVMPTAGRCQILGHDSNRSLYEVLPKIGSIVETPAMFPGFSGRRNLELLARSYGIGRKRIDEVLGEVALLDRARDRVKNYSLGMKQRLGIAAALLKDPSLLILDEPANGLDPAGIVEVRRLMRRLGDEGRTIFVSSHVLSEVQTTCDRVAILARGKCVAAGSVGDVLSGGRAKGVLVKVSEPVRAREVLTAAGLEVVDKEGSLRVAIDPDGSSRVTEVLASAGLYLSELRPDEVSLETVFLELTGDGGSTG